MNKRRLHRALTAFRAVKPWHFLVLALLSGVICVFAMRANNEHMVKLRAAVYAADKSGQDVRAPLHALQAYVTTHMNTDLSSGPNPVYPPIQLKYTYDRLVKAQSDQIAQSNTQLYNAAQHYCEQQNPTDFSGRNRVPCIEQYVLAHNTTATPIISDALYKFSFVSPRWSPDLAGWSLLVTVLFGLLAAASFTISRLVRTRAG